MSTCSTRCSPRTSSSACRTAALLAAELRSRLADARDLQDRLDICRRWAHGRQFQAGLQVLLGIADAGAAAAVLAAIAEVVIGSLLPAAERLAGIRSTGRSRAGHSSCWAWASSARTS